MRANQPGRFLIAVGAVFLILIAAPYLVAWGLAGETTRFGGFLLNPQDGNSYLAKMWQGWHGEWQFHLPFTPERGDGAYIFLFYLALGHAARWLGAPLLAVYHAARLAAAIALLISLAGFWRAVFPGERDFRLAFFLSALGSGAGWLALPFGQVTSDLWVAEAFPFLSAYTNPHFPLGLALLLWLVRPRSPAGWGGFFLQALGSLLLAIALPFGAILAGMITAGTAAWRGLQSGWSQGLLAGLQTPLAILLGAGPVSGYYLWAVSADPLLAAWNAQNLTPSPGPGDLAISLSPALLAALPGLWIASRARRESAACLVVWLIAALVMLYLPLGLQRRFMMGIFIPVSGLAVIGFDWLSQISPRIGPRLAGLAAAFSLPSNLIVILLGLAGAWMKAPELYLAQAEVRALAWIDEQTPAEAVILAGPESGLLIPAYTGRRVIYGHPFETIQAEARRQMTTSFFAGDSTRFDPQLLAMIDYVYAGPREAKLGPPLALPDAPVVYRQSGVTIYRLGPSPGR